VVAVGFDPVSRENETGLVVDSAKYQKKCALKKNILQLQVFGDLAVTIKSMNNEIQVHSTGVSQLVLHLKDISGLFQMISFIHI
jgi:hypothetical protein